MYSNAFDIPNVPGFRREQGNQGFLKAQQRQHRREAALKYGRGGGLDMTITGQSFADTGDPGMDGPASAAFAQTVMTLNDNPPVPETMSPPRPASAGPAYGQRTTGPAHSRSSRGKKGKHAKSASKIKFSNKQPSWVMNDKQVLRFQAYFEEPVFSFNNFNNGNITQSKRIRKMMIDYYLVDCSVAINELKQENSGLPQGRFVRRTKLEKPDGTLFQPQDFRVGGTFKLNNRKFYVVDANSKSRAYFEQKLGEKVPAAIPFPDDGFDEERKQVDAGRQRVTTTKEKRDYNTADRTVLRFFCAYEEPVPPEAKDRGSASAAFQSAASSPWVSAEDAGPNPFGESNKATGHRLYTLHYYVYDDTVEVKSVRTDGVQSFPYLLKKSRLPFNSVHPPNGVRISHASTKKFGGTENTGDKMHADDIDEDERFVTYEDLRCGDVMMVYGHPLLLLSCDATTEAWYKGRGIKQRPLQVLDEAAGRAPVKVPPYNGFGDEADLYAMGLSLQPRLEASMQEQWLKFMKADNKILRFTAKTANLYTGILDVDSRDVVINYYLQDDTIQVYEPPIRNSGIVGGTLLTRMRYKKYIAPTNYPDAPLGTQRKAGLLSRWFRPADFIPGADLTFEMPSTGCPVQRFKVFDYDEFTRKLVEGKGQFAVDETAKPETENFAEEANAAEKPKAAIPPHDKTALLLARVAELCTAGKAPLRSSFKARDPDGKGIIHSMDFVEVLRDLDDEMGKPVIDSRSITSDDLDQIMWEFAVESPLIQNGQGDGGILVDYGDFVDAVVLASPEPTLIQQHHDHNVALEEAMLKVLRGQFARRDPNSGRLRRTFRMNECSHGVVDREEWFATLRKHKFHSLMTKSKAEALRKNFLAGTNPTDPMGDPGLDYNLLCDAIYPGDFDKYVDKLLVVLEDMNEESPHAAYESGAYRSNARSTGKARPASAGAMRTTKSSLNRSAWGGASPTMVTTTAKDDTMMATGSTKPSVNAHAPTMRSYLREMNDQIHNCGGDEVQMLQRSMQSFCSSFSRPHRKVLLRKTFVSFDMNNSGRLYKDHFLQAIDKAVGEAYMTIDHGDIDRLATFLFPQPKLNLMDYERFMTVVFSRDVSGAVQIRKEFEQEKSSAAYQFR